MATLFLLWRGKQVEKHQVIYGVHEAAYDG